ADRVERQAVFGGVVPQAVLDGLDKFWIRTQQVETSDAAHGDENGFSWNDVSRLGHPSGVRMHQTCLGGAGIFEPLCGRPSGDASGEHQISSVSSSKPGQIVTRVRLLLIVPHG